MTTLSVASWNINSVRIRLAIVERLIDQHQPDVLCLQETKVEDGAFPRAAFEAHGYVHQALCGQRNWHGVALLSRVPFVEEVRSDWQANGEARHIGVRLQSGVRIENVYVPAGGDIPDRAVNPKFGQKLDFLERMTSWSETVRCPTILVGDLNIAPLESDVWSHKQLIDVVSHTPIEVETLGRLQASGTWADLGRHFVPAPQRLYTWWSYRARDWAASDRGRRLDHVWGTPDVAAGAVSVDTLEAARGWERPSDHVPLIARFAL